MTTAPDRRKQPPKVANCVFRDGGYYFRKMVNGQQVSRPTGTADPREAARIAANWAAEFSADVKAGRKQPTLHTLIDSYLETKKSKDTMICHFAPIKSHIADKRLIDMSAAEVINAMDMRKCAHNTRAVMINYWLAFVRWAELKGYGKGPTIDRIKKKRTREYYLTIDEVQRLFRTQDPDATYRGKSDRSDRARQDRLDLMVLLFSTGARYSEIAMSTFAQWEKENNIFHIIRNKGGINLKFVCTPLVTSILIRRFNDYYRDRSSDRLFPRMNHNNTHKWIHDAVATAGIAKPGPVTLHTLRHSFAKLMLDQVDIASTQHLLGHRHISTTMQYIHLRDDEISKKASDYIGGIKLI